MRDVSNIYANIGYYRFTERSYIGPEGPYFVRRTDSFSLDNCPLVKRARGDLIHSDGYEPTFYRAYDLSVTPGRVDFATEPTYNPTKKRWDRFRYEGSWYPDVYSLMDVEEYPATPDYLRDRIRTRVLNRLVDQKVNLANNLGEIRQNATHMLTTLTTLIGVYRAARRGDWRRVRRLLRIDPTDVVDTVRDHWLAYKFGWRPLMSDLYNLRSAILSSLEEDRAELSAFAHGEEPRNLFWENTNYVYEGDFIDGVQAKYWFRVDSETLQGLNALGFANPLSLAWELAPYSFVVDWFFGVSNFLSGLSAPLGLEFTRGYETFYTRGTVNVSDPDLEGMTPCKTKAFNFLRVPSSDFPRPVPGITLGLNRNQVLTSVALLSQRL